MSITYQTVFSVYLRSCIGDIGSYYTDSRTFFQCIRDRCKTVFMAENYCEMSAEDFMTMLYERAVKLSKGEM